MSNRDRDEYGQYTEVVTTNDVLAIFDDMADPCEPVTASEIADALDCDRKTSYNKLTELTEHDLLRTKKIGARARVWWRPSRI